MTGGRQGIVRRTLLLFAAASIGAVGAGHAADLGLSTAGLGTGSAAIAHCDSSFTPSYTVANGRVTVVTVGGIADPACEGGQLSVTLANSGGASIGAGGPMTVLTDAGTTDNSATVPISPQPAAPQVANIHISIVGP
jgi:hypothetical protein